MTDIARRVLISAYRLANRERNRPIDKKNIAADLGVDLQQVSLAHKELVNEGFCAPVFSVSLTVAGVEAAQALGD